MSKHAYLHSVNLKTKSNFPYLVIDANEERSTPKPAGFRVMHWHEDFQFIYVLSGFICVRTLCDTVTVQRGECIFINKNVVHQIQETGSCHYKSFLFPARFVEFYPGGPAQKYIRRMSDGNYLSTCLLSPGVPWCRRIMDILDSLIGLEENKSAVYEYEVLVLLSRLWLEIIKNTDVPEGGMETETTKRMQLFLRYVEEHYSRHISLGDLAGSAHVSKSECLRCFKQTMQTTPYRYIMRYRLSQAMALLQETDKTIGEIAGMVGFNQLSHFGKCFREQTGCSPGQYRIQHRQADTHRLDTIKIRHKGK